MAMRPPEKYTPNAPEMIKHLTLLVMSTATHFKVQKQEDFSITPLFPCLKLLDEGFF